MEIKDNAGPSSSSSNPLLLRLQNILKSIESRDISQSEKSVSELAEFLDSASESVATSSNSVNEDVCNNAIEMLMHTLAYICSPSVKEEVIDALSFILPKEVCKFSRASSMFSTIAESIVEQLVLTCNPRDMLTILCEALNSSGEKVNASLYLNPLLGGISKVLLSIKRRQLEQTKVAIPVILQALKQASLELDDEVENLENLFGRAIDIADSIRTIHQKLEDVSRVKLRALLGLYILQIMAFVSLSIGDRSPNCLPLVSQLSCFFHHCQLSYVSLLSGSVMDNLTGFIEEDDDDVQSCFSNVELGASLSVIWGYISDDVAQSAKEDLGAVENVLRHDQTKRWRAIGMLKHIFSSADLPWRLKEHAIDFLFCITEGDILRGSDGEHPDFLSFLPSLFAALQGIQMVIIYSPDAPLRKKAYDALKRVLADIPTSQRFDMLKALVMHSNSPSMTAILLDCVREEMRREANQRAKKGPFWRSILELVELVLRPSKGGPPALPEETDAVSSALNLYRFVLIAESRGNTNYSRVLSETNLRKAYKEWLLPLRTLVTSILAENKNDCDHLVGDMVCGLYPVEVVLYRCIELVEAKLK
ncbi:aberrant root formation protein 4 isoform X2 [Punica granatum]|uniref:Aberrant root formation protein 4 isoform X2 n=1 Tax=Punica granatum TaxID=22663 RepID=A0A6P8EA32_PUNGR|nr:aberrant root formation protein 4 isoform X2 [Punica granatum]